MLKCFSTNFIKKDVLKFRYINSMFSFGRKITKKSNDPLEPETQEIEDENPENIKVSFGTYPYLPLNDHPLIPGYGRLLAVTSEITEKLKEMNAEKTKIVVSVVKNPEKIEALQAAMYILPKIQAKFTQYLYTTDKERQ
jgi:hypothetical protein